MAAKKNTDTNWTEIKNEYITERTSYRKLAAKYNLPFHTIQQRALKDKWVEQKKQYIDRIESKSLENAEKQAVDYRSALYELAFNVAQDLANLTRSYTLEQLVALGVKPKDITGAIKDLEDALHVKSDRDIQEQEARIKNLRKQAEAEAEDKEIKVIIKGSAEDYSDDSDVYKFHTEKYGIAAQFVFRLPDGTVSDREATIVDNRITIDIPRQATSQLGIVECECKIYAVDEEKQIRVLTSARFNLYISDVILDEDTQNRITDEPTMYEKAIAKGIAEGTISTADAKRKNSQICTAQIVDVARSYYRKRGSAETGYNFVYGQDETCLDDGFDPATGNDIDCSTFIGLCLRGIPLEKSPYESLYNKADIPEETDGGDGGTSDSNSEEGEKFSPRTVLANKNDYAWATNPAEYMYPSETSKKKVVRTAAQLGQMMVEQGLKIDYDETFIDVEPGDIIFYAKNKNGEWVQPKRYMKISHVSICVNKIYNENFDITKTYTVGNYCYLYADADKGITEGLYRCITDHTGKFNPDHFEYIGLHRYRHPTIEASTGDPVLYNRTLERNKDYICLICRPDLGAVSNAEWTGNLVTDLGITNIDNLHRDGLYYLTSNVTGGLPVWIRNTLNDQKNKGTGYALRVESTYRQNGNVYSIIQTLIDTRHDNEMSNIMTANGLGILEFNDNTKDWYVNDNVKHVFTPEQFGAVADGVTDDTQAFNDMFNNISDYALVYLTGKYKLTNNIDVAKAVNIIGNDGAVLYCQRIRFKKSVYCKNVTFNAEDNTNDSMECCRL
ncbi:unnamed protein product [Cylicocyclus nassatus]|uniref:Uncharacterized protein n=1 Tax=Cylicocyclus nassatus TaxID=53992 RepID=A0AA36HHG0_CYLNA|nr:unnamed protein product [Cylicocyclus nassatus]